MKQALVYYEIQCRLISRVDPNADLLLQLLEGHLGVLALRRRPLAVHVDRRTPARSQLAGKVRSDYYEAPRFQIGEL